MNLLQVPSSVIGLMGARPRQQNPMLGLVQPQMADEYDQAMFSANPDGYGWQQPQMADEIDQAMFAANPNGMNTGWSQAPQAQLQAPAQRQRASALNVLGRAFAPNITGALDTERARLQAEADRPNQLAIAQENERISRALGPQALLALRTNQQALGEGLAAQYKPTTTGAGGVSTVFGTGQQVEAPRVLEFGNDLVQTGPISGTRTLATRGPSYSEQASLARAEQDAAQAEARLDLDYRRLDQADRQFNQTYEQREREYLRQADFRSDANGGRGKITEGQAKDGFNASRLEDAGAIIAGLEGQGFDFGRSGVTGGQFREGFRSYDAAAEEWTDAMLRLTTGAAATKQEMASNRRSYFPQPGDSEAVRKQKAARRAQLQQDAIARAGPGYFGGSADSTGTVPDLPRGFVLD